MAGSRAWLDDVISAEDVSPRVIEAFKSLDRADFVPPELRALAYEDRPVGIPERQTTSQPSLIVRMVDAARVQPDSRVLEVGTGYGFQTALLARLADEVVSIERHEALADAARRNLERAGIKNATVVVGDGWLGWPDEAPYDAIIVSAAAHRIPEALLDQLVEGGRLVIPLATGVGDDVYLFVKDSGRLRKQALITPARFVPLVPGMPS